MHGPGRMRTAKRRVSDGADEPRKSCRRHRYCREIRSRCVQPRMRWAWAWSRCARLVYRSGGRSCVGGAPAN